MDVHVYVLQLALFLGVCVHVWLCVHDLFSCRRSLFIFDPGYRET